LEAVKRGQIYKGPRLPAATYESRTYHTPGAAAAAAEKAKAIGNTPQVTVVSAGSLSHAQRRPDEEEDEYGDEYWHDDDDEYEGDGYYDDYYDDYSAPVTHHPLILFPPHSSCCCCYDCICMPHNRLPIFRLATLSNHQQRPPQQHHQQ
jgi:hypothetical protein